MSIVLASIYYAPGQWWDRRRFASLIPSGCRLTPIHKVMGDHASVGPTTARLSRNGERTTDDHAYVVDIKIILLA